jgi:3-deoxy-manno-octulosonate cytidylyltransferase (CMP-KDO synthetase)
VIPARLKSTRFPGKVLADVYGKPMVARVYEAACMASTLNRVVVATDSEDIAETLRPFSIICLMTSAAHRTGTDRVAEVARTHEADIFVNIQGDEPLIEPETIDTAVRALLEDDRYEVVNLCARITLPQDLTDATVPKVVKTASGRAICLSRAPIPYPKNPSAAQYFRQICVYAFRRQVLLSFAQLPMGAVEAAEEIELLRFIENDIPVKMVEVTTRSFGVDTPADLERARREYCGRL